MSIQRALPFLVILYISLLSGCTTSGIVEPVAEVEVTQTASVLVPVTSTSDATAYPPPDTATVHPGYPIDLTIVPTWTPEPEPTDEPTWTPEPLPTPISTPEVTPVPTAEPPFIPLLPDQEPQTFSILYTEESVIWAIDSSGGDPYPLVDVQNALSLYIAPTSVTSGEWAAASPDGTMLAVVLSSQETYDHTQDDYPEVGIYLYDVQQQTWNKLVDEGIEPVWSPDGTKIAYRGPQGGLWVVDVATSNAHEVYAVEQEEGYLAFATNFSWAPDSQRLVFMDAVFRVSKDVMIVDTTQSDSVTVLVPSDPYWPSYPRWSSMGEQILYTSHVGVQSASENLTNLWMINSDGSGAIQITQDLETITGGRPSLSPNDEWIAITGHIYYEATEVGTDLLLVNAKNGELRRLSNTPDMNEIRPIWSPGGTYLVVQRAAVGSDGSSRSLWLINLYDGSEMELASFSTQDVVLLP